MHGLSLHFIFPWIKLAFIFQVSCNSHLLQFCDQQSKQIIVTENPTSTKGSYRCPNTYVRALM